MKGLPISHPPSPKRSSHPLRQLLPLLLLLPATYYLAVSPLSSPLSALLDLAEPELGPLLHHSGASCPAQGKPLNVGADWKPAEVDGYVEKAVKRLQGAVHIETQSYDDMKTPENDDRFSHFAELHDYLKETFPLVHEQLKLEKIKTYGLLYTWKGSDSSLKPLVLMAHQDVVPVNPSTVDQWTYPPFSAHQDKDGWIWGRGVADCKNTLIGILAALEQLAEEDFKPTRSIILSSGYDEEIGGSRSAKYLAELLHSRYGPNGVALILDEGFTGVDTAFNTTFARFGMAEKGAVNLDLTVLTPGGHSSVPPLHTDIGILSRLLVELESKPSTPKLREGNPMLSYLNCAADYGTMDHSLKQRVRSPKKWQALGEQLAAEDPITRAFLGTTQAIDLIHGGVKVNALPEFTTATVNYRIDFLESVNGTATRIADLLAPVVKSFNLTFDVYGSHSHVNNNVVRLSLTSGSGIEPAPLASTEGPAFELMSGTAKHVFPGAVVAPSAMIANTDTKWSWKVSDNIYRFVPGSLDLIKNFHTVDERIHIDAHLSGIQFFHKLVRNTEGWSD